MYVLESMSTTMCNLLLNVHDACVILHSLKILLNGTSATIHIAYLGAELALRVMGCSLGWHAHAHAHAHTHAHARAHAHSCLPVQPQNPSASNVFLCSHIWGLNVPAPKCMTTLSAVEVCCHVA